MDNPNQPNTPTQPGGLLVGNSHDNGGIKIQTPEGQIEAEGGETILNKRSMASQDVIEVKGTPKEIASAVNEYKGGVSFKPGADLHVIEKNDIAANGLAIKNNSMDNKITFERDENYVSKTKQPGFNFQFEDNQSRKASGIIKFNKVINEFDVDIDDTYGTFKNDPADPAYRVVCDMVLQEFTPGMNTHYDATKFAWGGIFSSTKKEDNQDAQREIQKKIREFSFNVNNVREDYRHGEITGSEYADYKQKLINEYSPYISQANHYGITVSPGDLMILPGIKSAGYIKAQGAQMEDGAVIAQARDVVNSERAIMKFEAHEMEKTFKISSITDRSLPTWYGKVTDIERYIKENKDLIPNYNQKDNWETALFKFDLVANAVSPTLERELAARGTVIRSTDASQRPSPSISATVYPQGFKMEGNDGNLWEIHIAGNGVHRWVKVREEDGTEILAEDGHWIQGSIQHPGILRNKAKSMGLLHGNQTLSETDLQTIERLGGKWPARVRLARQLKSYNHKAANGMDIAGCGCEVEHAANGKDIQPFSWENYEDDNWQADYNNKTFYVIRFDTNASKQYPYKIMATLIGEPIPNSQYQQSQPAFFAHFETADQAKRFTEEQLNKGILPNIISKAKQGIVISPKKKQFSVDIDYQDVNGEPETYRELIFADDETEAIAIAETNFKTAVTNYIKINGGSSYEVAEHGKDIQPDTPPAKEHISGKLSNADKYANIKASLGVFGDKEFWRLTSSVTNEIGVYPKHLYTELQAKRSFYNKYIGKNSNVPSFHKVKINKDTMTILFINYGDMQAAQKVLRDSGMSETNFEKVGKHLTNLKFINWSEFKKAITLLNIDETAKAEDGAEIYSSDVYTKFTNWIGDILEEETPSDISSELLKALKNKQTSAKVSMIFTVTKRYFDTQLPLKIKGKIFNYNGGSIKVDDVKYINKESSGEYATYFYGLDLLITYGLDAIAKNGKELESLESFKEKVSAEFQRKYGITLEDQGMSDEYIIQCMNDGEAVEEIVSYTGDKYDLDPIAKNGKELKTFVSAKVFDNETYYTIGEPDEEKALYNKQEIELLNDGFSIELELRAQRHSKEKLEAYLSDIQQNNPEAQLIFSNNEYGGNWRIYVKNKKAEDGIDLDQYEQYNKIAKAIYNKVVSLAKKNNGSIVETAKTDGGYHFEFSFPTPEDNANYNADIKKLEEAGEFQYSKGGTVPEHNWVTGIHLDQYSTVLADGTEFGWDADYGLMVAYQGKVIPVNALPSGIKVKAIKGNLSARVKKAGKGHDIKNTDLLISGATYSIEFLNAKKNHKKDRKEFDSYEKAEKWGKNNLDNFHPDMITIHLAKNGMDISDDMPYKFVYLKHEDNKSFFVDRSTNKRRGNEYFYDENEAMAYADQNGICIVQDNEDKQPYQLRVFRNNNDFNLGFKTYEAAKKVYEDLASALNYSYDSSKDDYAIDPDNEDNWIELYSTEFAKGGSTKPYPNAQIGKLEIPSKGEGIGMLASEYYSWDAPLEVYEYGNKKWQRWDRTKREEALAKYTNWNPIASAVPGLPWRSLDRLTKRDLAVGIHNDML